MRSHRMSRGQLSLTRARLHFILDDDGQVPLDCTEYVMKESNLLVQEFMLTANESVAKKIAKAYEWIIRVYNEV